MPSLAERAGGANLRWHERTIQRFYDDEPQPEYDESNVLAANFAMNTGKLAARKAEEQDGFAIEVRGAFTLIDKGVQARADVAVQFLFFEADPPPEDEIEEFVRYSAMDYLLGYLRSELTQMTMTVGLPPALFPPVNPDWQEIRPQLYKDAAPK